MEREKMRDRGVKGETEKIERLSSFFYSISYHLNSLDVLFSSPESDPTRQERQEPV